MNHNWSFCSQGGQSCSTWQGSYGNHIIYGLVRFPSTADAVYSWVNFRGISLKFYSSERFSLLWQLVAKRTSSYVYICIYSHRSLPICCTFSECTTDEWVNFNEILVEFNLKKGICVEELSSLETYHII